MASSPDEDEVERFDDPAQRESSEADARLVEMTFEAAELFILALLLDGRKHTTPDIAAATAAHGKRCPDSTVRFLSRLRLTGKIHGELSVEHRTWLWWHPDHPDAPAPPTP